MGSTGEADRKRRQFSSISPTAASAKKQPFLPLSEDKKLDAAVLQYKNEKIIQKLEAQKVERVALENKICLLKDKQKPYDQTLIMVNKSLGELVDGLESCSLRAKDSSRDAEAQLNTEDGVSAALEDVLLSRLVETGATESSSTCNPLIQKEEDTQLACEKSKVILHNIISAIDILWCLKDGMHTSVLKKLPEDGSCRRKEFTDLQAELKSLRAALGDLYLRHKSLSKELQCHQDTDARNKAELKHLKGELEATVAELQESNSKLATLRRERDAAKGAFFPVLSLVNKPVAVDRTKDKQKDLQEMESALKELKDQVSCRLGELKHLHEERIGILMELCKFQNTLKNVNSISKAKAYGLVREQLAKSKADLSQYQSLCEKLQVEKDRLAWREKEMNMKSDVLDVCHRNSVIAGFRITELGLEIQKQIQEKNLIESKLEEASREPGRKEIIAEFKALVSSFNEDMGSMQSQLTKYKEASSDVHSMRADVQSLSIIVNRKVKELEALSARSVDHIAEIRQLREVADDLEESHSELKLILEMYSRESTDSRDVLEARDSEYKAWAHVQSLQSSLDEHNLESRVKTAIEAEAISQQRLAAAEAEIADLRQKLEASKREKSRLSDILKSKHEENEAYLSEIETIGQAYDDMQTQNQQLLQQITERDDYNTKLVLEGVRARQLQDALLMEKQAMEREILRANAAVDFYHVKAAKIEDQLTMCSDQVQKLAEDQLQSSTTTENFQKKLLDVRKSSQQLGESLEISQTKVLKTRGSLAELQIELEKERFVRKRIEEELEVVRRKALRLRSQIEGSSVLDKLQQELREYKEILKCSICLDRRKEVVITKCYHLFCNSCIQRIIETRHRKCPVCAASFGANDVKPIYI